MKATVIVQNRHIQRAIAAYEASESVAIGTICPLHQAIEEAGIIQGVFTISVVITAISSFNAQMYAWFEPRLPEVLWTPSGWPTALASGKEYKFELELEQEAE